MYCYTNKETGINALIEALRIPVTEMRVCTIVVAVMKLPRGGNEES